MPRLIVSYEDGTEHVLDFCREHYPGAVRRYLSHLSPRPTSVEMRLHDYSQVFWACDEYGCNVILDRKDDNVKVKLNAY